MRRVGRTSYGGVCWKTAEEDEEDEADEGVFDRRLGGTGRGRVGRDDEAAVVS